VSELAGSIISPLKNEHDPAIGNLIGSRLLDLLAMLVVPGASVS
jgi:cation:H+ antiporter